MALMPAIMSLFGSAPSSAPTTSNPASPTIQQQQQANVAANPTVPSSATPTSNGSLSAIPAAGTGDESPFDQFKELWKTDPNTNQQTKSLVPAFNLDHKGLLEAASKVDFTAHINPELVTKALAGDATSLLAVINQASQFAYASAAASSGELIKGSLTSAQNVLNDSVLPAALRNREISQAIDASNPIFQNPAVAPMLENLKMQFANKYPTSSPTDIAAMATQYLSTVSEHIVAAAGGTVVSKQQQQRNRGGYNPPEETDWDAFASLAS